MNVMNSPVDYRTHDDHLKHLLDQRAARADLHGRFPSVSEFSDSPSLYSHPQFSPRPPERSLLEGHPHSFRFPQSPRSYAPPLPEPRSPITDRERLNIPTASSLDLEDDPRSSSELNSTRDDEESDSPLEDAEDEPRISMYGPKMRFHSPAPWEEDDLDSKSVVEEHSLPKRVKKKSESGKKGWPLSRGSTDTRPSNESSRSGKGKQSFDNASTVSASGALAYVSRSYMFCEIFLCIHTTAVPSPRLPCLPPRSVCISRPILCGTSCLCQGCDPVHHLMLAITMRSRRQMLPPSPVLPHRLMRTRSGTAALCLGTRPIHPPEALSTSIPIRTRIRTSPEPSTLIFRHRLQVS